MQSPERREVTLGALETLSHDGQADAPPCTLREGRTFRDKTPSDGRRQILGFLLAGDCIGVQQRMGDAAAQGVDTPSCVFQRDALRELHRPSPSMGFDTTWLMAHAASRVDGTLLPVGRRSAGGHRFMRDVRALARLVDRDGRPPQRPLV